MQLRTAGPLAVAPDGALYVADVQAHRVLVRLPDGRFRVVAGTGTQGFAGDGGPATRAELSTITDLAVAPSGSVYIADGGRIRVVGSNGVIHTVAGDGRPARNILSPTPALSAPLGSPHSLAAGTSWLAIAFGPTGQLYVSTGSQILRLTRRGIVVPVRALVTTGPTVLRGDLSNFGPIAVDRHGNIYVSGVNGWAIWQVAPNGEATEVANAAGARRSGGGYSVLERGPDGSVYGEDGPNLLRIAGHGLVPVFGFTARVAGEYFELTYFAVGPDGAIYADEGPGNSGFAARQQLLVVRHQHETLLWEQPTTPTPKGLIQGSTLRLSGGRATTTFTITAPAKRAYDVTVTAPAASAVVLTMKIPAVASNRVISPAAGWTVNTLGDSSCHTKAGHTSCLLHFAAGGNPGGRWTGIVRKTSIPPARVHISIVFAYPAGDFPG